MYRMGPIGLVFGLVLGGIYLAIQLNIASTLSETVGANSAMMTYTLDTEEEVVAAAETLAFEIYNPDGKQVGPGKAVALLAPERFNRARVATFVTFVDPMSLLKEGEELPHGMMLKLMVEARGARLADAACDQLLAGVAATCGVKDFVTTWIAPADDDAGEEVIARRAPFARHFKLTTTMVFTPNVPVGPFPEAARVTFNEREFRFEPWEVDSPSPEAMTARAEEAMLAATKACTDIREIYGNCAITEIHIEDGYHFPGKYRTEFELAYFTPLRSAPGVGDTPAPAPEAPAAPVE